MSRLPHRWPIGQTETFRRFTVEERRKVPEYVDYCPKRGLLVCGCCGHSWPTGYFPWTQECPNCGGDGSDIE
jgi:hypothetical protein